MTKQAFDAINTYGQVVEETERYSFYQLPEVKDRYDSNFMKLRVMPDLDEFQELVDELWKLARKYGNTHGKVVFPEGVKPDEKLMAAAKELRFEWSFLELYEVMPSEFIAGSGRSGSSEKIKIGWITPELVDVYGQMHFDDSVQWGEAYATAIRAYKKGLIERGAIRIVVALLDDELVGATDVILSEAHVEIDNFYVKPNFQKRGIGTAIQQFVMNEAGERKVILVADGEDTPRNMYQRQGYQFVTFQYAALCQEFVK